MEFNRSHGIKLEGSNEGNDVAKSLKKSEQEEWKAGQDKLKRAGS